MKEICALSVSVTDGQSNTLSCFITQRIRTARQLNTESIRETEATGVGVPCSECCF